MDSTTGKHDSGVAKARGMETGPQFGIKSLLLLIALIAATIGAIASEDRNDPSFGASLIAGVLLTVVALATRRYGLSAVFGIVFVSAFVLKSTIICKIEHGARSECANQLHQVAIGLLNYEDKHRSLPPVCLTDGMGTPVHSWRTLILPEIEEQELFNRYRIGEPWNSPHNKKLTETPIGMFRCPRDNGAGEYDTSYVAIVGPNTAWATNKGTKLSQIKDRSKTILLIEMKKSGIKWAEPRDLDLSNLPPGVTKQNLLQTLSNHADGSVNVVFADGHTDSISSSIPWVEFEAMLSISGGETKDRSK
jgi:prepilin-type processing-associated H-X9-DG protein